MAPALSVTSADGTEIHVEISGRGPPLIVVHGTAEDHTVFDKLRDALGGRFRLYMMDRRGRGKSGDHPQYSLEREAEDLLAVIGAMDGPVDGPVNLFAHSFGGLCALEAARRTDRLSALMIYEVPIAPVQEAYHRRAIERMTLCFFAGDMEALFEIYLGDFVGLPGAAIDKARNNPANWAERVARAPSLLREVVVVRNYPLLAGHFDGLAPPLRFLQGENTSRAMKKALGLLARAIPGADTVELPGQGHVAMLSAPDLLAAEMIRFFEGGGRP